MARATHPRAENPTRFSIINPPGLKGEVFIKEVWRCGIKGKVRDYTFPQIGLAYVAAVVEEAGLKAQIIDGVAEELSKEETLARLESFDTDVAVIHTTTPSYMNDSRVSRAIRESMPGVSIGLVGTHPNALPEESLRDFDADFVLLGEAESTIGDLILRWNEPWNTIDGLCFRNGDSYVRTRPRPEIKDLDSLPFPARHLLPSYVSPFDKKTPYTSVIPSRGCPYQCTYCRAGTVWKDVRFRSPQNVLQELELISQTNGIREILFFADTFTLHKPWVMELCELLVKSGIGVSWSCNSRVDSIDEEMLEAMKAAGCHSITYGIESGSQEVLDRVKKLATVEDAEVAVRLTKEIGIKCIAYFLVGLPGETWETIGETMRFALRTDPDYILVYIATPYPGTEFHREARREGWLLNTDWESYTIEGSAVIQTEHLTPEDLIKAQRLFYRRFYFRPSYIFRHARRIRSIENLRFQAGKAFRLLTKL